MCCDHLHESFIFLNRKYFMDFANFIIHLNKVTILTIHKQWQGLYNENLTKDFFKKC